MSSVLNIRLLMIGIVLSRITAESVSCAASLPAQSVPLIVMARSAGQPVSAETVMLPETSTTPWLTWLAVTV